MKSDIDRFRIREDKKLDLGKFPTKVDPVYASKADYKKMLHQHVDRGQRIVTRLLAEKVELDIATALSDLKHLFDREDCAFDVTHDDPGRVNALARHDLQRLPG